MTTPAEDLQRIFKTLSDPTRVRILCLLAREELVVQELMDILGMAQSRVSRHLAILREAGLLQDRRTGTFVSYRFDPPTTEPWAEAWAWVSSALAGDPAVERDAVLLERVVQGRGARSGNFFDSVGPEWDALRKVLNDDALRARAITRLVEPGLRVADIGTGTGVLALELAKLGLEVVGIDRSARMLDAARAKVARDGAGRVELRQGDASALPLGDGEVRAAFAHMVLQYLPEPALAIAEMARIVAPGGVVVLADFVRHTQSWMRAELEVVWLGFETDTLTRWLTDAGLRDVEVDVFHTPSPGRDLPATFVASGRKG